MFTPSFILIPAREIIPGREIGLITAWFLITQILAFIFPVLFLWAIDWIGSLFGKGKAISVVLPAGVQMADGETAPTVGLETGAENLQRGSLAAGLSVLTANIIAPISHHSRDIDADAWRHLESTAWEQARQQGDPAVIGNLHAAFGIRSPRSDVSTFHHRHHQRPDRPSRSKTSPARFTLPFLAHRHSSAVMPPVNVTKDDIDLTETEADLETRVNSRRNSLPDVSRRGSKVEFDIPSSDELFRQLPKDGSRLGQGSSKCAEKGKVEAASDDDDDTDPVERLSSWISDLITPTIYLLLTIVGIPLYFVLDVGLPLFLGINILTFILAITVVPPKIRRFLHPILSCSISTVLLIWAFGAMRGLGLMDNLNRFYSVDARYSDLWSPSGYRGPVPGAGDVLFSTLDAGIVALAVPMYRYRSELKANFAKMMVVLTFCAALSLFLWNSIAALMGMDETRSLAFTARFMSTPLAIELAGNIGADESITVILVVLTGIIAAILKDHFFRFMRVDREDHLIVGITMGSTAGAIGASSLISTPKVMAVASLSFVIFGSILLIATAIPPVVDVVRMLA
jgi:putative effector of murein hydrolase